MDKLILKTSLSDSVYFSLASFLIIWGAGTLYAALEKSTGKVSMPLILIVVFSLILVMFFLAVFDLILREHEGIKIKFIDRILGVLIFIGISAIIIGVLFFLFWVEV
ncbi:hypothetical protein JW756_00540 [Candidatus Woesearchaeota archaeon]|nr:hypothetical protein [Candidatus Woesearchaeota archaeon]